MAVNPGTTVTNDDRELIRAQIMRMIAETGKLHEETMKISKERAWHPLAAGAGAAAALIGATAGVVAPAIKLLQ